MCRFVPYASRPKGTMLQLTPRFMGAVQSTMHCERGLGSKWKNLQVRKDPFTMGIYMNLIQDLEPKSILQFGNVFFFGFERYIPLFSL